MAVQPADVAYAEARDELLEAVVAFVGGHAEILMDECPRCNEVQWLLECVHRYEAATIARVDAEFRT